ncbi:predicted protein [Naegleria gruberi]|uniref:Predicted protein n=1 Tax=Naegleria gruberi TaxID=5762 RepID=D2V4K6_NAEGR|nr:uncharacterized protein NAEGRDRAFT_63763 [Naegleria gruberi]EFC48403.1 predicted protein [Naegleria gruberi]|eukprot:XP_002681147.1 predicted protein [Naegleria gruberi strain NEG-M]
MKLNELEADVFPLIYSFIYELPLKSYEKQEGNSSIGWSTLAFPHTCSKILTSLDSYAPFQFEKFIQFYCLGIKNHRYEELEPIINGQDAELKDIIPVVFYLNFPQLSFIEHLQFERDLIPMERKIRKSLSITRNRYEDFLFKIDRIIEMLSSFIKIIKKKLGVDELTQEMGQVFQLTDTKILLPISSLVSVIENVDQVVNKCMKIFHWKAFRNYYFEEEYLQVPKELPLINKKYRDCERIISILKNNESFERADELLDLLSNLECYYCDKLAASISQLFFQGQFVRNRTNIKLLRMMLYYGMYNNSALFMKCPEEIQNDEEIVKRFVFSSPNMYSHIPSKFKQDSSIIEMCIFQSDSSIEFIYEETVGRDSLFYSLVQYPTIFYTYLAKCTETQFVQDVIEIFIEVLKHDKFHPTLQSFFRDGMFLRSILSHGRILSEQRDWDDPAIQEIRSDFEAYLSVIDTFKREYLNDHTSTSDLLKLI